jgi:hypothetical protein
MSTLGWYLADLTALLHDQSYLFSSRNQLVRWVNEARRQAAQRTGCIQRLVTGQSAFGASAQPGSAIPGAMQPGMLPGAQPFSSVGAATSVLCQTIPGVERYPYVGFFNPVLQQTYAGCDKIIDVGQCAVNWGGTVRPALYWLPWEEFQAKARAYATLVTSYPYYWTTFNDGEAGEVWMFPAPSQVGDIELNAFCIPTDLQTDNDFDAIPGGFENGIKFLAASLAFQTKQMWVQSQIMEQMFNDRLMGGRAASDRGKVPNWYAS